MADRIDSREFTQWMVYYSIEPWGEEPTDLRHGILSSLIANANRDEKKQREPFEPKDFMLNRSPTPASQPTDAFGIFDRDDEAVTGEGESGGWRETKRRFMALVKKTDQPK